LRQRAVDDEGEVLDLLVHRSRDKTAAVKLMRKLLKKQGFAPDVMATDKLRSYGAARSEMGLSAHHEQGLRSRVDDWRSGCRYVKRTLRGTAVDCAVGESRRSGWRRAGWLGRPGY
jgi:transposase-like protein